MSQVLCAEQQELTRWLEAPQSLGCWVFSGSVSGSVSESSWSRSTIVLIPIPIPIPAKLSELVCEYRSYPSRRWRFDFPWPERILAMVIEGEVASGRSL